MAKIFLSYRRDDAADIAGRIRDRLVEKFGKKSVFTDVDSIPFGENFRNHINQEVTKCDIFLAIIGPDWLSVTSDDGQRRLNDPKDFVRVEIESALSRQIPVIPVLVRGASIPDEKSMPESLKDLTLRNGIPVRADPDFHRDLDRLINSIIQQTSTGVPAFLHTRSKFLIYSVGLVILAGLLSTILTLVVAGKHLTFEPMDTRQPRGDSPDSQPTHTVDQSNPSTNRDDPIWLTGNEIRDQGVGEDI